MYESTKERERKRMKIYGDQLKSVSDIGVLLSVAFANTINDSFFLFFFEINYVEYFVPLFFILFCLDIKYVEYFVPNKKCGIQRMIFNLFLSYHTVGINFLLS